MQNKPKETKTAFWNDSFLCNIMIQDSELQMILK